MKINKEYALAVILNVSYCIILLNITVGILILTSKQSLPYSASIMLIALFYILELILFYSNIPSIGILILSFILAFPYHIYKTKRHKSKIGDYKFKLTEVIHDIKINILKLSNIYIPCKKAKICNDSDFYTIFKFQL